MTNIPNRGGGRGGENAGDTPLTNIPNRGGGRVDDNAGNKPHERGAKREKGDSRRGKHGHERGMHEGPTRPGGSSRGKPGSDSNAESDDE